MDIFKQKRNLTITIIILVIINIVTITLLWIGRPEVNELRGKGPADNKNIQKLLKDELGFSDEQTNEYLALREKQRKETRKINREMRRVKREMFDKAFEQDDNTLSDSLLNLTLEHQAQLEKAMFNHFVGLKEICNDDQKEKLKEIIHKLFAPPHPPGGDRPPPHHARGDRPPPPRD